MLIGVAWSPSHQSETAHIGGFMNEKIENVLEKHKEILFRLESAQIFTLEGYSDGSLCIREMCDEWFNTDLSKEECIKLSELFKDLGEVL